VTLRGERLRYLSQRLPLSMQLAHQRDHRAQLIKAVYGARSKDASHGSLMMTVKGAQGMIVKRKLRYVIKKERDEKGITLGLHPKR